MSGLMLTILLVIIGILSGLMASMAGLASLVSYPGLIAVGLPPIEANVTGTFAMIFSGIGSTIASRKELRGHWKMVLKVAPLVFIGCVVGSLLLFAFPQKDFARIAPFFVLASAFLVLRPQKTSSDLTDHQSVGIRFLSWLAILLVGVYSGYFGAAAGVLMLALLNVITGAPFAEYNAMKNVVMTFANLVSMVVYALNTTILWGKIIPLAVGYLIGGSLGPKLVRRIPQKVMKTIVAVGAVVLFGWLFWRAYF